MSDGPYIAEVASLVGDPARANMLSALMGGRALTATELALTANVAPPTASGHLAKLLAAGLVEVATQGRHRYYRLGSADVARMLEGLMAVAVQTAPRHRPTGPRDARLALSRTCYDHLAGRVAVAIADRLCERRHVELSAEGGSITKSGEAFLASFGAVVGQRARRAPCRPCLDWSERRYHIGGAVGRALLERMEQLNWLERSSGTRLAFITDAGWSGLNEVFGLGHLADLYRHG